MQRVTALSFIGLLLLVCSWSLTSAQDDCAAGETCQPAQFGLSEAEIAVLSIAEIESLRPSNDILFDRSYRRVDGLIDIYDAPNGNIISTLDAGYNFITVRTSQDGWTEINPGEWIQSSFLAGGPTISRFAGILVPEGMQANSIAWTLINVYPSRIPGEQPYMSNSLLYRYTQVNIYASIEVNGWTWYQVGPEQWLQQTHVAKYAPIEKSVEIDTENWISIDLYEQTAVAYEGETPVFATLIAAGLDQWPTHEGLYHIYFRRQRHTMNGGRAGYDSYYLEEVPWTMFFDEGRALHGAYWHDEFGYRHSHGCINLSLTDAHWLYRWVSEEMGSNASADIENGPAVYIYSSGEYQ